VQFLKYIFTSSPLWCELRRLSRRFQAELHIYFDSLDSVRPLKPAAYFTGRYMTAYVMIDVCPRLFRSTLPNVVSHAVSHVIYYNYFAPTGKVNRQRRRTPFKKGNVTFRSYNCRLGQCKGQTSPTYTQRLRDTSASKGGSLALCTAVAVSCMRGKGPFSFGTEYSCPYRRGQTFFAGMPVFLNIPKS